MMAAIAASGREPVLLLDRNEKVGKKLFITGKGRCNLCNDCADALFFERLHRNASFMYSSYYGFSTYALQSFFTERKVPLKVERGERVFPVSDKSSDIIRCLEREIEKRSVEVRLHCAVTDIQPDGPKFIVQTEQGTISADKVILATGGMTYPKTGSRGDGYEFAKKLGHSVIAPLPGLVGLRTEHADRESLTGLSLKNVRLYAEAEGRIFEEFGEMLFTHYGISGPIVLSLSSKINRLPGVRLYLDLKPSLSEQTLDARILREIAGAPNKEAATLLATMLPKALVDPMLAHTGIDRHLPSHQITREMRARILHFLKAYPLEYRGLFDADTGIVTTGGVEVREVDPSTMESKRHRGLYFAGELLDVDGPTGGYNLQIAFSTGHLAGTSAAQEV